MTTAAPARWLASAEHVTRLGHLRSGSVQPMHSDALHPYRFGTRLPRRTGHMMTSTPPQTLVSPQRAEIGASIRVAVLSEQVLLSHVLRNALVGRDGIDVVFHVAGRGQPA